MPQSRIRLRRQVRGQLWISVDGTTWERLEARDSVRTVEPGEHTIRAKFYWILTYAYPDSPTLGELGVAVRPGEEVELDFRLAVHWRALPRLMDQLFLWRAYLRRDLARDELTAWYIDIVKIEERPGHGYLRFLTGPYRAFAAVCRRVRRRSI